jgi:hypothetical protein
VFIQVIEFRSSKPDELAALVGGYREAAGGKTTARRGLLTRSRDDDTSYVNIVFFDSYEEAMKNSELPETSAFAEKMMAICDGPPTFHNLDVVVDDEM